MLIIFAVTFLVMIGFAFDPFIPFQAIASGAVDTNPICSQNPIECSTNADCNKCLDSETFELSCQKLSRNPEQRQAYGESKKYCLPKKPNKPCNEDLGGIWTWTGWADTGVMEWECLCTYPHFAGNKGCTKLNPNVCRHGLFGPYSATVANRGPNAGDCVCREEYVKVVTTSGIPMCIPKNEGPCTNAVSCSAFYSTD